MICCFSNSLLVGNVKKFTLQSINALNPLFHSLSDRKLYESALKEVIAWYKTRPEDRVIPVWKPGDEDTQGDGTFTSEGMPSGESWHGGNTKVNFNREQ